MTSTRSQDIDPCFDPSGRYILFSSDRGGVYNIFRYDIAAGSIERVTDVDTGAFSPEVSPDSTRMVFVGYSADGYDIFESALDEGYGPPTPEPSERPFIETDEEEESELKILAPRPYSAWRSVLPKAWTPVVILDSDRQELGAFLSGRDALSKHVWAADVSYTFGGVGWRGDFTYVFSGIYPTLSVNAWYSHTDSARGQLVRDGGYPKYDQHSFGGSIYASMPIALYWSYHRLLLH